MGAPDDFVGYAYHTLGMVRHLLGETVEGIKLMERGVGMFEGHCYSGNYKECLLELVRVKYESGMPCEDSMLMLEGVEGAHADAVCAYIGAGRGLVEKARSVAVLEEILGSLSGNMVLAAQARIMVIELRLDLLVLEPDQPNIGAIRQHLDQLFRIAERSGSELIVVSTTMFLSTFYMVLGDSTSSASYLERARELAEKQGNEQLLTSLERAQERLESRIAHFMKLADGGMLEKFRDKELKEYLKIVKGIVSTGFRSGEEVR